MLFDPGILVRAPVEVAEVLAIVMLGKSFVAYLTVRAFRRGQRAALTIAASLAQVGEFSFILAVLGQSLGLLPAAGQGLIVAAALISIALNPVLFWATDRVLARGSVA
jgi:CPA2 family monovalent cation:H+ antiporter-2